LGTAAAAGGAAFAADVYDWSNKTEVKPQQKDSPVVQKED